MNTSINHVGSSSAAFLAGIDTSANGDLETVMLSLCFNRTSALDKVIQGQVKDMQARNSKIQEMNKILQDLRAHAGNDKAGARAKLSPETIKFLNDNNMIAHNQQHLDLNVYHTGGNEIEIKKDGAFGSLIENMKTQIDNVSSNSQLDMIKLQGLINKRNQSTEMMSNMVQKFSSLMDKIVGNMR